MTIRSIAHPERKARALAITICAIWANWNDDQADACDDALTLACEEVRALDLAHTLPGTLGDYLRYFARANLDDVNPLDQTIDQMVQALSEGLALASLAPRSASDATGN